MSAPYLRDYYTRRFGCEILVPDEEEQFIVDRIIFNQLVRRDLRPESRETYLGVIDRLRNRGAQGVILGCTEIFLLVLQADRPGFPMFNTTALHVERAVNMALDQD
jgi:aspartate racemase